MLEGQLPRRKGNCPVGFKTVKTQTIAATAMKPTINHGMVSLPFSPSVFCAKSSRSNASNESRHWKYQLSHVVLWFGQYAAIVLLIQHS